MVKTLGSQGREHGFNPWLGNQDPTSCVVQQKKKKKKKLAWKHKEYIL